MNHEPCKIEEIDEWTEDYERLYGFLIKECHTTADIARLIISQGWEDEIMEYLSNPEFVKSAK